MNKKRKAEEQIAKEERKQVRLAKKAVKKEEQTSDSDSDLETKLSKLLEEQESVEIQKT